MTLRSCAERASVRRMLALGHWPDACPVELRTHLESCPSCKELVLVTDAFTAARIESAAQASLPAPGLIWWRAQLRRRNAAMKRVTRPLLGASIFALMCTLVAAVAAVAVAERSHFVWFGEAGQPPAAVHWGSLSPALLLGSNVGFALLIAALATLALLSALAVYLGTERL
jgi:hypothetical protein